MSGHVSNLKGRILNAAIAWRRDGGSIEQLSEAVDTLLALRSQQFKITKHAIERFRTRSGRKNQSMAVAQQKIANMLDSAKEVQLKPEYLATQLINHGFKEARYFKHCDWMLVVAGESVVTCYRGQAGRWK
jgi:hypothetical protein